MWAGLLCGCDFKSGRSIEGIDDSKKLSEKKREALYDVICDRALAWNVVLIGPDAFDEDMGLITLEAMAAKPVLTVADAGGVTEFVQDGVNGRIVAPQEAALADALDDLLADPARLRAMGEAAQRTAASVTWERTASALLAAAEQGLVRTSPASAAAAPGRALVPQRGHQRPATLVGSEHVWRVPARQRRQEAFVYLYRGVAQWADVTLLNLGESGSSAQEHQFGPHYRQVCVAPSRRFEQREAQLTQTLQRSVTDIAALLYHGELTEYREAFVGRCGGVRAHVPWRPWCWRALAGAGVVRRL